MLSLSFFALRAQTENDLKLLNACKKEVNTINSQTLYKKQYVFGVTPQKRNLTIVDYKNIFEGIFMVFYDAEQRIRKYITTSNYPEGSAFDIYHTITNVRRANLRKAPSTDADRIAVVELGSIVQILERTDEQWYRVKVNGQTGYIFGELLEPVEREIK